MIEIISNYDAIQTIYKMLTEGKTLKAEITTLQGKVKGYKLGNDKNIRIDIVLNNEKEGE